MSQQGKTTGNLKMRSGPGLEFDPPIAYLVPDTPLEIIGEVGEWWQVRAGGKEGYVGKKYVAVAAAPEVSELKDAKASGGLSKPATARPPVKVGAPKAIAVDADAVDKGATKPEASRPSAPKAAAVKTTVTKAGPMKPKGPPPRGPKKD